MSAVDHTPPAAATVRLFGRDLSRLAATVRRYGLSTFGPLSVSGAHFLASIILLHALPRADFGLFSFVIVFSALCLGLTIALIATPIASMAEKHLSAAALDTYLKANVYLGLSIGVAMFATMRFTGARADAAALFGVYGGAMSLRLFARTYAYTIGRVWAVILSDCTYSFALVIGLALFVMTQTVSILAIASLLAAGAVLALLPFGTDYSRTLMRAMKRGSLRAYGDIWRHMTRWSLLGVLTTEVTSNAHAYLVTFIYGSQSFALLAVGSLFMRPLGLVLVALPDQERPAMARSIAAGDKKRTLHIANEFRIAMAGLWLATAVLAAIILTWFPDLIVKNGYDKTDVVAVVSVWMAIMAVRALRAPDGVLLQAAREFKPLANASVQSSVVTFLLTLALLLLAGPIASLGGILIGDIVMMIVIRSLIRRWKASNG